MNYTNIYESLIARARGRKLTDYVERHHIIPRCMGGGEDISNLVELTAEEHFVAHQLLVKIYPDNRNLLFAAHMMTRGNKKHSRNNKEYGWLRKRRSIAASEFAKGRKRGKYTKTKPVDAYVASIEILSIIPILPYYTNSRKNVFESVENVHNIVNFLYIYAK